MAAAGPGAVAAAVAEGHATDRAVDWFRHARFGLFILWGPVTLEGTEIGWSRDAAWPHLPVPHPAGTVPVDRTAPFRRDLGDLVLTVSGVTADEVVPVVRLDLDTQVRLRPSPWTSLGRQRAGT